ncbi:MAG TPA: D-alanyl-D-alanine carboxypeptidase [Firmicutes bacterium]|nr:D-alanyl-D-alanine carboxypeptidase [Candidatus Fermentithermobacillaceae bacterium]
MLERKFGSRIMLSLLATLLIAHALLALPGKVASAAESPPEVNADIYLIADLKTGRIVASKNAETPHIPASLTKIMTMYILFDDLAAGKVSLDDMVPVSEKAWATGGSKMFILVGTEVKLEDLVKGITVMSGNDACVAVAEYLSGSVTAFVDRMNAKARELGLTDTHFVDPHGLSDDNRVSAKDLLKLVTAYVHDHPEALPYHAIKEFAYTAPGESTKDPQFNRNRLLWSYPGAYGLKTGFTTMAGFNMVALVERSGLNIVAIVLGSAKGYSIDAGERARTEIVTSLLDWAYRNYSYVETTPANTVVGTARVWKGRGGKVEAIAPRALGATVEKGYEDKLVTTVVLNESLEAPVQAGSKIGEVIFTVDGQEVGREPLVAKTDVPKGNIFRVLWDSLVRALGKAFRPVK